MVEAGLHPTTGGSGFQACSGDLLLEALVACAGVTFSAVSTAIGVNVTRGTIRAEGDLEFKGTLGDSKDVPVGFRDICLYINFDSDASVEQIESLVKRTERYCVVYQTITRGVKIDISYND